MKCSLPYPILPRYPFPVNSTSYKNVLLLLSEVTSQFFFPAIYQFIAHIKRKKKKVFGKKPFVQVTNLKALQLYYLIAIPVALNTAMEN